jgi:hypothetical protein
MSHYKAALQAHHAAPDEPTKTKMRGVADQHLNHLIPLMHLAARAGAHSKGKLALEYTKLPAWETNYTTVHRHTPESVAATGKGEVGKFRHDNKKLGRRPAPGARQWSEQDPEQRGVKDYHYLEMPPHPGHDDVSKMPHQGGYPWEEVQIGSQADIEAKKGFVHIEDVPDKKEYTPHPFDSHPIRKIQDVKEEHLSPDQRQEYAEAAVNWRDGPQHQQWDKDQEAKYNADPAGYEARGNKKSAPLYEGIPLQEQLGHVHASPAKPRLQEVQAGYAKAQQAQGKSPAVAPTVRQKAAAPVAGATPGAPHPYESVYQTYLKMPKPQQDALMAIPDFRKYVATKGGK